MAEAEAPNEFDFYMKFTKSLVLNLPAAKERALAAGWVRRLKDKSAGSEKLRIDYLKLLLFVLQRGKLGGPFLDDPRGYESLDELPDNYNILTLAKCLVEKEQCKRREKIRKQLKGEIGDSPPYSTDYSSDLLEYVAAQDIPNFGVHAYYAFSKEPIPKWYKAERAIFPKAVRSAVDTSSPGSSLLAASSAPEVKAAEQKDADKDKGEAEGEKPPEGTPPKQKRKTSTSSDTPEKKRRTPKRGSLGNKPPTTPLGTVPPPEDRAPPTWGSNLIEVKATSLDDEEAAEEPAGFETAASLPYLTPPLPQKSAPADSTAGGERLKSPYPSPRKSPARSPVRSPQLQTSAPSLPYATPPPKKMEERKIHMDETSQMIEQYMGGDSMVISPPKVTKRKAAKPVLSSSLIKPKPKAPKSASSTEVVKGKPTKGKSKAPSKPAKGKGPSASKASDLTDIYGDLEEIGLSAADLEDFNFDLDADEDFGDEDMGLDDDFEIKETEEEKAEREKLDRELEEQEARIRALEEEYAEDIAEFGDTSLEIQDEEMKLDTTVQEIEQEGQQHTDESPAAARIPVTTPKRSPSPRRPVSTELLLAQMDAEARRKAAEVEAAAAAQLALLGGPEPPPTPKAKPSPRKDDEVSRIFENAAAAAVSPPKEIKKLQATVDKQYASLFEDDEAPPSAPSTAAPGKKPSGIRPPGSGLPTAAGRPSGIRPPGSRMPIAASRPPKPASPREQLKEIQFKADEQYLSLFEDDEGPPSAPAIITDRPSGIRPPGSRLPTTAGRPSGIRPPGSRMPIATSRPPKPASPKEQLKEIQFKADEQYLSLFADDEEPPPAPAIITDRPSGIRPPGSRLPTAAGRPSGIRPPCSRIARPASPREQLKEIQFKADEQYLSLFADEEEAPPAPAIITDRPSGIRPPGSRLPLLSTSRVPCQVRPSGIRPPGSKLPTAPVPTLQVTRPPSSKSKIQKDKDVAPPPARPKTAEPPTKKPARPAGLRPPSSKQKPETSRRGAQPSKMAPPVRPGPSTGAIPKQLKRPEKSGRKKEKKEKKEKRKKEPLPEIVPMSPAAQDIFQDYEEEREEQMQHLRPPISAPPRPGSLQEFEYLESNIENLIDVPPSEAPSAASFAPSIEAVEEPEPYVSPERPFADLGSPLHYSPKPLSPYRSPPRQPAREPRPLPALAPEEERYIEYIAPERSEFIKQASRYVADVDDGSLFPEPYHMVPPQSPQRQTVDQLLMDKTPPRRTPGKAPSPQATRGPSPPMRVPCPSAMPPSPAARARSPVARVPSPAARVPSPAARAPSPSAWEPSPPKSVPSARRTPSPRRPDIFEDAEAYDTLDTFSPPCTICTSPQGEEEDMLAHETPPPGELDMLDHETPPPGELDISFEDYEQMFADEEGEPPSISAVSPAAQQRSLEEVYAKADAQYSDLVEPQPVQPQYDEMLSPPIDAAMMAQTLREFPGVEYRTPYSRRLPSQSGRGAITLQRHAPRPGLESIAEWESPWAGSPDIERIPCRGPRLERPSFARKTLDFTAPKRPPKPPSPKAPIAEKGKPARSTASASRLSKAPSASSVTSKSDTSVKSQPKKGPKKPIVIKQTRSAILRAAAAKGEKAPTVKGKQPPKGPQKGKTDTTKKPTKDAREKAAGKKPPTGVSKGKGPRKGAGKERKELMPEDIAEPPPPRPKSPPPVYYGEEAMERHDEYMARMTMLEKTLPPLPPPEDLIGMEGYYPDEGDQRYIMDEPVPDDTYAPLQPVSTVHGWRTPEHLRRKPKTPAPFDMKIKPTLRDIIDYEAAPPDVLSPTGDYYRPPSPPAEPYLITSRDDFYVPAPTPPATPPRPSGRTVYYTSPLPSTSTAPSPLYAPQRIELPSPVYPQRHRTVCGKRSPTTAQPLVDTSYRPGTPVYDSQLPPPPRPVSPRTPTPFDFTSLADARADNILEEHYPEEIVPDDDNLPPLSPFTADHMDLKRALSWQVGRTVPEPMFLKGYGGEPCGLLRRHCKYFVMPRTIEEEEEVTPPRPQRQPTPPQGQPRPSQRQPPPPQRQTPPHGISPVDRPPIDFKTPEPPKKKYLRQFHTYLDWDLAESDRADLRAPDVFVNVEPTTSPLMKDPSPFKSPPMLPIVRRRDAIDLEDAPLLTDVEDEDAQQLEVVAPAAAEPAMEEVAEGHYSVFEAEDFGEPLDTETAPEYYDEPPEYEDETPKDFVCAPCSAGSPRQQVAGRVSPRRSPTTPRRESPQRPPASPHPEPDSRAAHISDEEFMKLLRPTHVQRTAPARPISPPRPDIQLASFQWRSPPKQKSPPKTPRAMQPSFSGDVRQGPRSASPPPLIDFDSELQVTELGLNDYDDRGILDDISNQNVTVLAVQPEDEKKLQNVIYIFNQIETVGLKLIQVN